MKRKIAAILVATAPAYKGLLAEDAAAAVAMLERARALMREQIALYDGRIFNTDGSSVLAEFVSAVEAVRCALSLQKRLSAAEGYARLPFRFGITIGDIVEHEGDLLGDGINLAARLAGMAEDGAIYASRVLVEQVGNREPLAVTDLGLRTPKNMTQPVHVLSLRPGAPGAPAWTATDAGAAAKGARRTAGFAALAGAAGLALVAAVVFALQPSGETGSKPVASPSQAPPGAGAVAAGPAPPGGEATVGEAGRAQRCVALLERLRFGTATSADRRELAQDCR